MVKSETSQAHYSDEEIEYYLSTIEAMIVVDNTSSEIRFIQHFLQEGYNIINQLRAQNKKLKYGS